MPHPILNVEDVTKTYDGFKAISNLNFYLYEGELRTVIGPNGAGKSTFFDLITGRAKPDTGKIEFGPSEGTSVDLTERNEYPASMASGFDPVRQRLGVSYEDDCLKLGLTWKRTYQDTGDAKAGNSFLLTLAFKNLGR